MHRASLALGSMLLTLVARCSLAPLVSMDAASDARTGEDRVDLSDATTATDVENAAQTYRVDLVTPELAPGEERTICAVHKIANRAGAMLREARVHIGNASHHLIVYRTATRQESREWTPCNGFSGLFGATTSTLPVVAAQQERTTLRLPSDPPVGIPMEAEQHLRFEFHVINISREPAVARASVELDLAPRTTDTREAHILFWGTADISVSPRATGEARLRRAPPEGASLFSLSSHTHQFGTLASVSIGRGAGVDATDLREVHRSTNWSDPPQTVFAPALRLAADEHLHLRCEYRNTSDRTLRFGESAFEEMCFLWAYYYPATQSQFCLEMPGGSGSACGVLRYTPEE
ncbi:MAG: hypothetical protein JNK05_38350 [Myxococcales bacterium]|nr:hypothetical protein [Myxococcales bacterium]